jgi:hypothetical protein
VVSRPNFKLLHGDDWFMLQHIWTPDVIIHDLVKFNKPEILNQVMRQVWHILHNYILKDQSFPFNNI